jgi:glycosyltransferase involved in cell wall biosynthesis
MDKALISKKNPLVSVLLPVFNGEKYIKNTIESILNQSYINFELIIINDCSTDKTAFIIDSFSDERIRVVNHLKNMKLIYTLNEGLRLCRGKYIARIDADDIAHIDRLKAQVEFLEENPSYVLVGTIVGLIKNDVKTDEIIAYYTNNEDLKFAMCFYCPFIHPSVMIRNEVIQSNNLQFDENYLHAEDYEFWTRLSKYGKIANIQDKLTYYRIHEDQISSKFKEHQIDMMNKIQEKYRTKFFNENKEIEIDLFFGNQKNQDFGVLFNLFFKFLKQNKGDFYSIFIINKIRNITFDSKKISLLDYFKIVKSRKELRLNLIQLFRLLFKVKFFGC